jgi:long-chain acyl-CoA synthetase
MILTTRVRSAVEVVAGSEPDALARFVAILDQGDVPVVTDAAMPVSMRDAVLAAVTQRLSSTGQSEPGQSEQDLSDEPLLVVLTSGSTGAPRAVVRTLKSWTSSHRMVDAAFGLRADDVIWAPGPLSSTLTLFAAHHAHVTGRRAVLSGPWRGVPAALAHGAADTTVVQAVPPIIADVLDAIEAGLLPRLRTAVVAGARVPARLREHARALGVRLVEYYGAAELSFVTIDGDPVPGADVGLRSCGRRDGSGEIWVHSPYVALGYVDQLQGPGPLQLVDGWATVGDHGRMRPDGTLEVLGRGHDAVTVGGHTVQVADVEAVLHQVPGVAEVVCVGEPHERFGQRLVAVVRPTPGADPGPALKAAARAELPPAARPTRWVVVTDLPRTPAGKIARSDVAALVPRLA